MNPALPPYLALGEFRVWGDSAGEADEGSAFAGPAVRTSPMKIDDKTL
jgi:hypothetical protein